MKNDNRKIGISNAEIDYLKAELLELESAKKNTESDEKMAVILDKGIKNLKAMIARAEQRAAPLSDKKKNEILDTANALSLELRNHVPRTTSPVVILRAAERAVRRASKQQDEALAKGRKEAVKKKQEIAAEKQVRLIKAIADLFDKPEKPGWGWSNPDIVEFLKPKFGYAASSIMQVVKREAAKFRKARKEQQASKFQNR
jgi:hypothetical protein